MVKICSGTFLGNIYSIDQLPSPHFSFLVYLQKCRERRQSWTKSPWGRRKKQIKINLVFVLLYCAFSVCFVYPVVFFCFMLYPCVLSFLLWNSLWLVEEVLTSLCLFVTVRMDISRFLWEINPEPLSDIVSVRPPRGDHDLISTSNICWT